MGSPQELVELVMEAKALISELGEARRAEIQDYVSADEDDYLCIQALINADPSFVVMKGKGMGGFRYEPSEPQSPGLPSLEDLARTASQAKEWLLEVRRASASALKDRLGIDDRQYGLLKPFFQFDCDLSMAKGKGGGVLVTPPKESSESSPPSSHSASQLIANACEYIQSVDDWASHQDIIVALGIDKATYRQQVKPEIAKIPGFHAANPRAGGGFRFQEFRACRTDANQQEVFQTLLTGDWERAAAERMVELFKGRGKDLMNLVDAKTEKAFRSYKRRTYKDAPMTIAEAASALIVRHGTELFRDPELRKAIAKAAGVGLDGVNSWRAGGRSAHDFVDRVGFPPEFEGEDPPERQEPFLMLGSKKPIAGLQPFQERAKQQLIGHLRHPGSRVLLELPTGAGKTRVAVDTIRDFLAGSYAAKNAEGRGIAVLWLAHQDELCEQAARSVQQVWENASYAPPLGLFRHFGSRNERYGDEAKTKIEKEYREDENFEHASMMPSVIVTTPLAALKLLNGGEGSFVQEIIQSHLALVVIDEAHRTGANTYQEVLQSIRQDVSVIGLTATPFRKDYAGPEHTDELHQLFHNNLILAASLFETTDPSIPPKRLLQEEKILANPIVSEIRLRSVLKPIEDTDDIQRIDQSLAKGAGSKPERTTQIHQKLQHIFTDASARILYFAPTVAEAQAMTFLLRAQGIKAECVTADTPAPLRMRRIEQFRSGEIRILCNVEILTTGFDAPRVTHVIVARPTVSSVLYEQIVGRGLRGPKFGGTDDCYIIDCIDGTERPIQWGYETFRKAWGIQGVQEERPVLGEQERLGVGAEESAVINHV
ncbi:MAG: DEAD/DEAH box helicase family protein [FCB group bacterium]|jgi:superfamily II DNA or RNA helicase|nr:DEAD/DEAH box helicase family protein [FCB group bacterium]